MKFPGRENHLSETPADGVKEHVLTRSTLLTATRPGVFAPLAAKMLIDGTRGVTPVVLAMGATDGEGFLARYDDKQAIKRTGQRDGKGTTAFGKAADPIADSLAFLEVAPAILKSERVSVLGKLATAIVLADETEKSAWAVWTGLKYKKATGNKLVIEVTKTAKWGTTKKFAAIVGATATHDLDKGWRRNVAGLSALTAAISGVRDSRKARRGYKQDLAPVLRKASK